MDFENQQRTLQAIVDGLGTPDVARLIQAMLGYYRDQRVDGVELDGDGDMLLFQWGTYDWGEGEFFDFEIVRQLIDPEEYEIFQLMLTMKFESTDTLKKLGDGNEWCEHPEGLDDFERFIQDSQPYKQLSKQSPLQIEISLDEA